MAEVKKIITLEKCTDTECDGKVEHEGICTRSPDATLWRIKVANDGTLSTEAV